MTTESPLWDWAAVSLWLYRTRKLDREAALTAAAVAGANSLLARNANDFCVALTSQIGEQTAAI